MPSLTRRWRTARKGFGGVWVEISAAMAMALIVMTAGGAAVQSFFPAPGETVLALRNLALAMLAGWIASASLPRGGWIGVTAFYGMVAAFCLWAQESTRIPAWYPWFAVGLLVASGCGSAAGRILPRFQARR